MKYIVTVKASEDSTPIIKEFDNFYSVSKYIDCLLVFGCTITITAE